MQISTGGFPEPRFPSEFRYLTSPEKSPGKKGK